MNTNFLRTAGFALLCAYASLSAYEDEGSPWAVNNEKGTITVSDTARRALAVAYGMTRDYIAKSQFDSAQRIVECLQNRFPTHRGINGKLVDIMLAVGDEKGTIQAVDHYCTYHLLEYLLEPTEDTVLLKCYKEKIAKHSIAPTENYDHQMFILGLLYAKTGRFREAIDSWNEVRKSNPNYPFLKDVDFWLNSVVPETYTTYGISYNTMLPTGGFADRFAFLSGFGFWVGFEGRYLLGDLAMHFSAAKSGTPLVYDRNGRSDSTSHVSGTSVGGDFRLKAIEFREFEITLGCPLYYSWFAIDDKDTINSVAYDAINRGYFTTGITLAFVVKTGLTHAGRIGVELQYLNMYGSSRRFPEMNDPRMFSARLCFGFAALRQKRQPIRSSVSSLDALGGIIGGILSTIH